MCQSANKKRRLSVSPLRKVLVLIAVAIGSASTALASGYQLNEHGAKATAMGGAFVARADDPSAIFFNPAGLSYIKGLNVMVGGTLISPSTTFRGLSPADTQTKMKSIYFFPPNAYVTYSMDNGIGLGVGVYSPYGLGTDWPADWSGRFIVTKINLQSFYINPSVSYSYKHLVSVGVGFDYILGNVDLEQKIQTPFTAEPTATLKGNGTGSTFNFGILVTPIKQVSVGFSYRGKANLKANNGTISFSGLGLLAGQSEFADGSVSTSVPLPATWFAGVAYKGEKYSIEADYQWVGWSAYKSLDLNITQGTTTTQKSIVGDYKDSYILRAGGQYKLTDVWTVRAGVFYDKNPVPDAYLEPILPDADRLGLNVGVGIRVTNKISVDASYMFLPFKQRTITTSAVDFNGTYNTTANLFGIDISYRL